MRTCGATILKKKDLYVPQAEMGAIYVAYSSLRRKESQ